MIPLIGDAHTSLLVTKTVAKLEIGPGDVIGLRQKLPLPSNIRRPSSASSRFKNRTSVP